MEKLETKYIAFDTQFIVGQNFLTGNLIKEFTNQAKARHIKIYITDIVYREVLKHFKIQLILAKSKNIYEKADKLYVLKHFSKYEQYFNLPEIDIEEGCILFKEIFDKWITETRIKIIDCDLLFAKKIFDDYFEMQPPFEESKKNEFPDAFSLEALNKKFSIGKKKCYLITNDEGVKKYRSETLIMQKSAGEILELILREIKEDAPIAFIERKFKQENNQIIKNYKTQISDVVKNSVLNSYTINGRLIDGIEKLEITIIDISDLFVIHINNLNFSLIATITFIIDLEVNLLSRELSGINETHNILSKDSNSFKSIKPLVIDMYLMGEYNIETDLLLVDSYSFSPLEKVID